MFPRQIWNSFTSGQHMKLWDNCHLKTTSWIYFQGLWEFESTRLFDSQRERESAREKGAQKLKDIKNCAAEKKYNGTGADKVRKSRASYKNIYHSTNVWLQRGLELICVFIRGGASLYRMGNTPQPRTFWPAVLIHNLLEPVIVSMKAGEGVGGVELVPTQQWRGGTPKMLLGANGSVINQTHTSTHLRYVVRAHRPITPQDIEIQVYKGDLVWFKVHHRAESDTATV